MRTIQKDEATPSIDSSTIPLQRIPKITTPPTPFLVILLIIASFLLGMLTTKVQYLEREAKRNNQNAVAGTQTQQATPDTGTLQPTIDLQTIKDLFKKDVIKFGDENKKVLFVEVADPSCPYCHAAAGKNPELSRQMGARFTLVTDGGTYQAPVIQMKKLVDEGKASFVYIYQNGHGNGELAMKALYCAYDIGKFWEVHDKLMTNDGYNLINNQVQNSKTNAGILTDFIADVVDAGTIKSCIESGKYDNRLAADMQVAQSLGVSGTPGFFVNTTSFSGAYSWTDMKSIVDAAL